MTENKGFYKRLLILTLPIVIQNLITTSLNMLDTLMIGNLGEVQLAAVGVANQFYFLYSLTDWNWYIINTVLEAADAFTGSENFRDLIERTFEIAQLASSGHGIESLFFTDYKWMMIEVLPIILTYNGKRGKPFKYAFYWFYPFHIYLIWGIRLLFD